MLFCAMVYSVNIFNHFHIELMKGNIWIESPSKISTNPKFPGMKYSLIDRFPTYNR